jgi:hypothetical protein
MKPAMQDDQDHAAFEFADLHKQGLAAGEVVLVAEALVCREVFFLEKSAYGIATVESASCDGERIELTLHFGAPGRWEGGFGSGWISYPVAVCRLGPYLLEMNGGYGVHSSIVHHPVAIACLRELIEEPHTQRQVSRLVRGADAFPEDVARDIEKGPPLGAGLPVGAPRCQVSAGSHGQLIAILRDMPIAAGRCLAWSCEAPVATVIAVCQACLPMAPDLMAFLLERDRVHRREHPGTLPAVAADADELFAHYPELAMLYHQPFAGVSLNGNMNELGAIRLLREVASRCGLSFMEVAPRP